MNVLQMFFKKMRRNKAFVVDDTECLTKGMDLIESKNISVDGFSDYKMLLYKLGKKKCRYGFGMIYENGSKYKPQMICYFIKQLNPNIKLYIYKNEDEFIQYADNLILT